MKKIFVLYVVSFLSVICSWGVFIHYTDYTDDGLKVPIAIFANWLAGTLKDLSIGSHSLSFIIAAFGSIVMHFIPQKRGPRKLGFFIPCTLVLDNDACISSCICR